MRLRENLIKNAIFTIDSEKIVKKIKVYFYLNRAVRRIKGKFILQCPKKLCMPEK